MITTDEVIGYLIPKLQRSGFPIEPETVTCATLLEMLKHADITPAANQVTDSGEGPTKLVLHLMVVKRQLETICVNAQIGPDPRMAGETDCYLVPLDDIEQANLILGLLSA